MEKKEKREKVIKGVLSKIEEQLKDADFEENVSLAVVGTIVRVKDAPSNRVDVETLQKSMAQGEFVDICWSNNTESWPPDHVMTATITKSKMDK